MKGTLAEGTEMCTTRPLKRPGKLRAHADLRAKEKYEVNQGAEAERDEADGCHCPCCGHIVEHEDTEMGECCGHDKGWDEKCCDC